MIVLSATVTSKVESDRDIQLFELFLCFDPTVYSACRHSNFMNGDHAHQLKDNLKSIIA